MDQLKLSVEVANQTQEYGGEVRLKWEEPPEPNGILVTYHIEYRRIDIESVRYQSLNVMLIHLKIFNTNVLTF